jgi:peptidyl-tRNA hydrolase, PTH1 family
VKIIVGLGNPGKKYERTRHNAGFMAIDEFAQSMKTEILQEKYHAYIGRTRLDAQEAILVKPDTYMNDSGRSVSAVLRDTYTAASDLIVVHDELDLVLGSVRIKIGGGHGGHNGLRSLIEYLGTSDFIRVRIGIGRPAPGVLSADYVLSPFLAEERKELPAILTRASDAIRTIILQGPQYAMNLFNHK